MASSLAGYVLAGKKIAVAADHDLFLVRHDRAHPVVHVSLYYVFARLGLLGNVYAVGVVLAALNLPLSVFLMRSFFLNVPAE